MSDEKYISNILANQMSQRAGYGAYGRLPSKITF